MPDPQTKQAIQTALHQFANQPLADAAKTLLKTLGYSSPKQLRLTPNTCDNFLANFAQGRTLNEKYALTAQWKSVDFLFQLTDDEIRSAGGQQFLFDSQGVWNGAAMNSYLFLAIELTGSGYTRSTLAGITREVNKLFAMPALILFRHGDTLTLAVINRRLHKRDTAKDVLQKVTLIKDIHFAGPHRAHIEILFDLSFGALREKHRFANFVELHAAWQETLDIQTLNKRFFIEVRNWFYWARLHARFPAGAQKDADDRDSEAVIRLLTRMIFCWFLREKGLLPEDIFLTHKLENILSDWRAPDIDNDKQGRYYKAILQNLFFATLATPVGERKFRSPRTYRGRNKHYGDQRYFRYVALFIEKAPVEDLYRTIPFLNGGLFENLDDFPSEDNDLTAEVRIDGFSDVPSKQPIVPDFLFFGDGRPVQELAELLGESATPWARGLLTIFRDYKFTVEENTPLEQDIALDPELLGRTFENLLAAVNPETGTVARKSTGSFYTPREIVHYMADEALVRYLLGALAPDGAPAGLEEKLRELVSEEVPSHRLDAEAERIVGLIGQLRILDPACGSGAFPMGLLQLLVRVLRKLDPNNEHWKAAKLASLPPEMRERAEEVFRDQSFDYTRKLELVKDCIHGVDIQPTAIQISKLRFFLSLVIEQRDPEHICPLPNLETKFVCANALLGILRPKGWELFRPQIEPKERKLLDVRARYFFAPTKEEKDACKAEDRKLRRELGQFIKDIGGTAAAGLASPIAEWDPYKSDRRASYFDPESMFGVLDGFDITIGNPPYVRADEQSEWNQKQRQAIQASRQYETLWEKWDLYVPFIERSYKLLRPGGISTLIVSDAFCHSKYAQKPQKWFLENARVVRLDFCGEVKIFDAAVHNVIYFFQHADGTRWKPERRLHRESFGNVSLLPTDTQENLTYRAFFPEGQAVQASLSGTPISDICYVSYGLRPNSDENEAKGEFKTADVVSNVKDGKYCKPYVEGKHLAPWLPAANQWIEWGTARAPGQFCRQTFPELHSVSEKILVQKNPGPDPVAALDDGGLIFNSTIVGLVPWHALHGVRNNSLKKAARYLGEKPPRPDLPRREDLEVTSRRFHVKYLLAVINSSSSRNFLRANRRHNVSLYPDDWKKLPIPDVSLAQQEPVVALVNRILEAKRADRSADVSALEAEVDALVSKLYNTPPESPPFA